MKRLITCLVLAALAASPAAHAKKKPRAAWQVMRATDAVTKLSTCAVAASDYVGKTRFTQSGALTRSSR